MRYTVVARVELEVFTNVKAESEEEAKEIATKVLTLASLNPNGNWVPSDNFVSIKESDITSVEES